MRFRDEIRESLKDKPKRYTWIYASFRDIDEQRFTGAVVLQVEDEGYLVRGWEAARKYRPENSSYGEIVKLPTVPPEQYRNRLLNRDEVLTFTKL